MESSDDDDDVIEVVDPPSLPLSQQPRRQRRSPGESARQPAKSKAKESSSSKSSGGRRSDDSNSSSGSDDAGAVLDLSRDDDGDSSVEISLVDGGTATTTKSKAAKANKETNKSSGALERRVDDSDSDSDSEDDDLLFQSPVFKKKTSAAVSRNTSSTSAGAGVGAASASMSRSSSLSSSTSTSAPPSRVSARGGGSGGGRKRSSAEERTTDRLAKEREKERKRLEREEDRQFKKARAEREKEQRKRKREEERAAKAQKKEDEKREKGEKAKREKQAQGKFAKDEILALVDRDLVEEGATGLGLQRSLGLELRKQLDEKGYLAVVPKVQADGDLRGGREENDEDWDAVTTGPGAGVVRWLRRDGVDGGARSLVPLVGGDDVWGGAEDADGEDAEAARPAASSFTDKSVPAATDDDAQRMDVVAVVFHDSSPFLDMLVRPPASEDDDDDDDDYPLLRSWLRRVRTTLRTGFEARFQNDPEGGGGARHRRVSGNVAAGSRSRLILVLKDVHDELNRRWNAAAGPRGRKPRRGAEMPVTESDLQDAIVWLLTEERVEAHLTSGDEETAEYVTNLTRALSEAPYYEDATELDCVKKIKMSVDVDKNDEYACVRDCWRRMVQQVPGLSEPKARKFVEHYPTLASLMEAYGDDDKTGGDEEGRRGLLVKCFADGKNNNKLSEMMWRLMTSEDPDELI